MTERKGALRRLAAPVLAAALLFLGAAAMAHGDEDHGAPPQAAAAATTAATASGGEAHSDRYEVVVQNGEEPLLTIYLDDYATNAPVTGASLSLVIGDRPIQARAVSPGTFEARLAQPLAHGTTNVDVAVRGAGGDDLLTVPVLVPEHEEESAATGFRLRSLLIGAGVLALLVAAGFLAFRLARRRPALAAGAVALVVFVGLTSQVYAHGDEPHGDEPATPAVGAAVAGDRPVRAADGSVILSKPSQRLLGVRTLIGAEGTGAAASRLQAQVIPDPARFARLATARGGRVLATSAGFPRPGQPVAAGQVLFQLQPALSASEAALRMGVAT